MTLSIYQSSKLVSGYNGATEGKGELFREADCPRLFAVARIELVLVEPATIRHVIWFIAWSVYWLIALHCGLAFLESQLDPSSWVGAQTHHSDIEPRKVANGIGDYSHVRRGSLVEGLTFYSIAASRR